MNQQLLRGKEVAAMCGMHIATVYRLEARQEFPRRVHLSRRTVRWRADEVSAWIAARAVAPLPKDSGKADRAEPAAA